MIYSKIIIFGYQKAVLNITSYKILPTPVYCNVFNTVVKQNYDLHILQNVASCMCFCEVTSTVLSLSRRHYIALILGLQYVPGGHGTPFARIVVRRVIFVIFHSRFTSLVRSC